MSRYKPLIERNSTDRIMLKGIVQNPLSAPELILRAKAILLFLDGSKGDAIAKELGVRPNTISNWRKKYEENGVEGLYDKVRKGRSGSSTRDQVIKTLEGTPPEGGWTTKALAETVGTSQDTVRRALRDQHITVSRAYRWDNRIKRSPSMVCVNAVGLYLAKEEAGLIIQVNSLSNSQLEVENIVTTSNKGLADRLTLMEQMPEGLSLDDAINASVQLMKEVSRGTKETFQDFATGIFKEWHTRQKKKENVSNRLYFIIYWHDSKRKITPVLQESGIMVENTDDVGRWLQLVETWISIMSNALSGDEPDAAVHLTGLINLYMQKTTQLVEPFEWRKLPA